MTVCIAAISDSGEIFGAADNMISGADHEYEPAKQKGAPQFTKIIPITNSIVAMIAGDSTIQSEILYSHVLPRIREASQDTSAAEWLGVEEAVSIYCDSWNVVRCKKAERAILFPVGLSMQSFAANQKNLSQELVVRLARELKEFSMGHVETIIAGIEPSATGKPITRIFLISNDDALCCDMSRYAVIGGGGRHALSHLMLAAHGPAATRHETLLAVYIAKKKAEVAPGVGRDTYAFRIGPALGTFEWLDEPAIKALDGLHERIKMEERRVAQAATSELTEFLALRDAAKSQAIYEVEEIVWDDDTTKKS